jgi:hypothetical protein
VTKVFHRTALRHRIFTGLTQQHLDALITELEPRWRSRHESDLRARRGHDRRRVKDAGPHAKVAFPDRLVATLIVLRYQVPHELVAELFGVERSTVSRAVRQVRPLLAARGFTVADQPGLRWRTLADVFAYAEANNITLRIDGTETQVRRPRAHHVGRRAYVSGKRRQNTAKTSTFSDAHGRVLFSGGDRPGRQHDQTCLKTEGIAEQFRQHPKVRAEMDSAYGGLATQFPDQITVPPPKAKPHAPIGEQYAYQYQRHRQSSRRIAVEHTHAEFGQWRTLQRYIGRREDYPETHAAIASLVSDRAAIRPVKAKTCTDLLPAAAFHTDTG